MPLHTKETDVDFFKLFNGCDEVFGSGKAYELAIKWTMEAGPVADWPKRVISCIVFYEKPKKFLLTGVTSKNKESSGSVVNIGLARYLPHHSDDVTAGETPEAKAAAVARANFPSEFKRVNFTCVRNVALIFLEAQSRVMSCPFSPPLTSWIQHYGGGPLHLLATIGAHYPDSNSESYKIRLSQLTKFRSDQQFWERYVSQMADKIKESYQKKPGAGGIAQA